MIGRRFSLAFAMIAILAGAAAAQTFPEAGSTPAPLVYYAGAAGRLTTDQDAHGGNPFASGLIEVLGERGLTLAAFGPKIAAATWKHSRGWQMAELPRRLTDPAWRFDYDDRERRVALVLVNADYSVSGVPSLPGARVDSRRVTEALRLAGFETTLVLDADGAAVRDALEAFAASSAEADVSLIYAGGHGVQHKRVVYWLLGDYPDPQSSRALVSHAFALGEIAQAAQARRLNLILYASCRDDPFDHD